MEKFADEIERLLEEKLSLYKKLIGILETEKTYIADMDVDSLWVATSQKKSLAISIEGTKQNIRSLFGEIYSGLDMDVRSFSLSRLIKFLNVSSEKRDELDKIRLAINTCKSDISGMASENKQFINEYLAIINGIFSTIMDTADRKGYNNSGAVLKQNTTNRLISAEV